ncbi:MAG: hypothetical protein R3C11_19315 [Planctomycetaceae bacterium]
MAGLNVGQVFRLKLTGLPEYPGVSLYPTIEVLDQLHPPQNEELNFPVEIEITEDEIQLVLEGGLVSKVLYLEQPQLAVPELQKRPAPTQLLQQHMNLLEEADRVGRPILLLRMGGREPANEDSSSPFFTPESWVTRLPQIERRFNSQSKGTRESSLNRNRTD